MHITSMIARRPSDTRCHDSSLVNDPEFLQLVKLLSHMFVLYYGILADVTPPVALAAHAAAGISGGNALNRFSGVFVTRESYAFFFIYTPALLLMLALKVKGLPIFALLAPCLRSVWELSWSVALFRLFC